MHGARSHPHPEPPPEPSARHDVIVVGGGHAGVEAALAAARLGARVLLATLRLDRIGEMSCNPAIGGLGKGQLVREVDALGGAMGLAADRTGIQFHVLNTAKGYAVHGPRCQSDRHLYREEVTRMLAAEPRVELAALAVEGLLVEAPASGRPARVRGIRAAEVPAVPGARREHGAGSVREFTAGAVVITTGTFLAAVMHTGLEQCAGGRAGEGTTRGLSAELARLGVRMGRLKTGTPPRLARASIDWDALEQQHGDLHPVPFSFLSTREGFPRLPQVSCAITHTNAAAHELIRANIHRAPMYAGRIHGVGPRYCPSVEDKVMRFAERERHQVFLEPEGLSTDVVYVNGVSTSLPAEVQEAFVRLIPGLERARFLRHGYAVEYDFSFPEQLDPTYALSAVAGLFLAGQINGTSGYEEAASQGLMAGANAALWVQGRAPFVLGRHEAYAGVLADDLVVSAPTEPYRMFTSRAEHRLLLRADDADRRLTPRALELGLAGAERAARLAERQRKLAEGARLLDALREDGASLRERLRRPEIRLDALESRHPELAALALDPATRTTLEADVKYAGYVERARADVERLRREESTEIPAELDLARVLGLRSEAREKLGRFKPRTLGQAGRIAGINPPDVALLSVHVARWRRERAAAPESR